MAAYEYKYRIKGLVKAPPEVTGKVCQDIISKEGVVTPARLVAVSEPKDAPLHGEFEWADDIAAQKYREEQARQIIKNIVIVEVSEGITEHEPIKCWVNSDRAFVPTDERTHRYVPLDTALNNINWRDNLIEMAKKDMIAFMHKYSRLNELSKIIDDMNDFLNA